MAASVFFQWVSIWKSVKAKVTKMKRKALTPLLAGPSKYPSKRARH